MDLLDVLQQILQAGIKELNLTDLVFGTVSQTSPLEVQIEGTMQPIPAAALVLTSAVTAKSYSGTTSGGETFTVPITDGLSLGDRVVMLRCAAGQRFVIISKA